MISILSGNLALETYGQIKAMYERVNISLVL
jgi:hypothetical protein